MADEVVGVEAVGVADEEAEVEGEEVSNLYA